MTGNDQRQDASNPRHGDVASGSRETLDHAGAELGESVAEATDPTTLGRTHSGSGPARDYPLPSTDGTREFRVHPAVPRLWFWQAVGWPVLVGGLACGGLLAGGWERLGQVAAGATLLAVWALTTHAHAYADRLRLLLLGDGVVVQRGVVWRTEIFIPRARVQHTDVTQGPIGRHFGVATLKVYTAASHAGVTEVEGLDRGDAVTVRDALLGRGDPDAL